MKVWLRAVLMFTAMVLPFSGYAANGTCTVASTSLVFPSYNALSPSNVDSTATVSVTCNAVSILFLLTLDVDYTITLSQGGAGSYTPRKMALLANRLNYNLYSNAARSAIWGDGTGGTATKTGSMHGTGLLFASVTDNHTVYGRIPGAQNIPAGAYADLITVTVLY